MGSTLPPAQPRQGSRTWHRQTRTLPHLPSTIEAGRRVTTVDATTAAPLELHDIQAGALYERPSPYVGTYLLLRIDDRAAGRELVRRLHAVAESRRASADPAHDT